MKLSEKLYNLRRKQGLSQEGLAEKLDCSRQVISKWENGTTTPDAEMLKKYSAKYGYQVEILEKKCYEGREISSSYIKEELKKGNLELVDKLLGYSYQENKK